MQSIAAYWRENSTSDTICELKREEIRVRSHERKLVSEKNNENIITERDLIRQIKHEDVDTIPQSVNVNFVFGSKNCTSFPDSNVEIRRKTPQTF